MRNRETAAARRPRKNETTILWRRTTITTATGIARWPTGIAAIGTGPAIFPAEVVVSLCGAVGACEDPAEEARGHAAPTARGEREEAETTSVVKAMSAARGPSRITEDKAWVGGRESQRKWMGRKERWTTRTSVAEGATRRAT